MDDKDRHILAAEYVLDLLGEEGREDARRAFEEDPAFRAAVAEWEDDLAELTAHFARTPPPTLKRRLDAALFGDEAPADRARPGGIGLWKALTGAFVALSLLLFAAVLLRPGPAPAPTPIRFVAPISSEAGEGPPVMVEIYPDGRVRVPAFDPAVFGEEPGERVVQLWAIPPDGAPVSIGLVSPDRPGDTDTPSQFENMTFAFSLEPPGGSPTGQPTGPVVATGPVIELSPVRD
ncbi:anti-sigma factor [Parvularcula oceani]|uniref:anti-sigma factor n=1 Tax=Parvularcula oceani TaxID=1247963 RepID=UPI0004E0BBAF|nr:anti-sigma factor [Parvularcula oceani]